MPLSAGILTQGRSGAFALKSTETGGVQRNIPRSNFSPTIGNGSVMVPLVNNVAYAVNRLVGASMASFVLNAPYIVDVWPADLLARAIGSAAGDLDTKNYHTLTAWYDNVSGDAPAVYGKCKFASFSGVVDWSAQGIASAVAFTLTGLSADPESASVTALTTPSTGALSAGNVKSSAQATLAGLSDYFRIEWNITTGLSLSPGPFIAGSNANYPYLPKGLIMLGLDGTVSVTQNKRATTNLSTDGSDSVLTLSLGTVAAGMGIAFNVFGTGVSKPSNLGYNMKRTTYVLKSPDGLSSPVTFTDL